MPLQEEFTRSGSWLFRWRSYFPLLLLVLFFASFAGRDKASFMNYDLLIEVISLLVCFFGLAIRVLTIGHTPAKTSGRNTKTQVAAKLNTTGMYSIMRHPLYIGNFFMLLGVMIFTRNIWAILVYILLFVIYYERIMFTEEAYLREKFGEEFIAWSSRTPVFPYRLGRYIRPDLPFSLRNVLKREYHGFYAVICSLFVLELLSDLIVLGKPTFDTFWIIVMGTGTLIWIVLRILVKFTRKLKVEGR